MAKEQTITVPDIGNNKDVSIIEILVKAGDAINKEDSVITLESDKAAMEIPSSHAGTVKGVIVKVGDKVSQGSPILVLVEDEGGTAPDAAAGTAPDAVASAPGSLAILTDDTGDTITVPDIGNNKDVSSIEVLVKVGDIISKEDSLITLESDKAAMEIPSPKGGEVKQVLVKVGDKVSRGSPVLVLAGAEGGPAPATIQPKSTAAATTALSAAPAAPASRPAPAPVAVEDYGPSTGNKPHASPAVRRFARELGANVEKIKGTGPKGRILKDDVQAYIKSRLQAPETGSFGLNLIDAPEIDFSQFGPIESNPLSKIRKLTGANLHRNWVSIPHVTVNEDADITDLEAFRVSLKAEAEKQKIKVTLMPFLIKAVVAALKAYPRFNSSLAPNGEDLIFKQYYHIGVAIDTPEGLVVPPVRDADRKSIYELAKEVAELSDRARARKLRTPELQGGTFTISSLGGIGGTGFNPIINAPEVAILGICKAQTKAVWKDGQFVPRLLLPLSLSFDHRVIDGADAARFSAYLAQMLEDMRRVLL